MNVSRFASQHPRRAVVFDWAGTLIDFGSLAPMGAFVSLFSRYRVDISVAEARVPMGLPKWDHIKALGSQPRIAAQWEAAHGRAFSDADVDDLYAVFTPMNMESVRHHSTLIDGVIDVVGELRERAYAIGSTTGYNRPIMEVVVPLAREQGFESDNLVCAGDLVASRPSPLMMYRTFADLGVWSPSSVIKVDDTAPGIVEGLSAGTWAVGVVVSGNGVGLSLDDWEVLDVATKQTLREHAGEQLLDAGAHILIDTVADLIPAIDRIEALMAAGVSPRHID
jgi:phosphonoacetaldehyde hydrolase